MLSRERPLRDRNTQMIVPGKSFRLVLQILEMAQVTVLHCKFAWHHVALSARRWKYCLGGAMWQAQSIDTWTVLLQKKQSERKHQAAKQASTAKRSAPKVGFLKALLAACMNCSHSQLEENLTFCAAGDAPSAAQQAL